MTSSTAIVHRLIEEGVTARSHFQVWWALRNQALPKYHKTMNDDSYVDFFRAANSGHYILFLLALAKIFDRDDRVAGIKELKRALRSEGKGGIANRIARELKPYEPQIKKVMSIRNRVIAHNEHSISRTKVYEINGITPNQLRDLIDAVCSSINEVAQELGIVNTIFDSYRSQSSTMNMLAVLERGRGT